MIPVTLAVEDPLSRDVALQVIAYAAPDVIVESPILGGGFGRLRNNCRAFNEMAAIIPVILFTDLDNGSCPRSLVTSWMKKIPQSHDFVFRVVVREIESWLMADRHAFAEFVHCPISKVPLRPEVCPDPKRELLQIVDRYAPKSIRDGLVRTVKNDRLPGFEFNERFGRFALTRWDPAVAATHANSLGRAIRRIRELADRVRSRTVESAD
jgi:hypothetical protein